MPALPDVPGVLRCNFHFGVGQDNTALVKKYYSYAGGAPSAADCVSLATDLLGLVSAWYLPFMGAGNSIGYVEVTDLTSPTAHQGLYTNVQAGTRTGGPVGAAVAVLLNGHIGRRYRGGKPRSYFPFGVDTDLTYAQVWAGAFTGPLQAAVNSFEAAVLTYSSGSTSFLAPVNVSYYAGFVAVENIVTGRWRNVPTVRTGTIPVDVISQWVVNPKVGSQRRRNLQRA